MKIVAEMVAAIILLGSGAYLAPKVVSEFRIGTLKKVDQGLPSHESFATSLQSR